jgi:hypothetical protein
MRLRHRSASIRPATLDPKRRTVEAVISTGAGVERRDAKGAIIERLRIDADAISTHTDVIPVLDNHRQESTADILGRAENIRIEGGKLIATLVITSAAAWARIADGTLRHLSIGYLAEAGREGDANGVRQITLIKWRLYEISFVTVPADPGATTRSLGMKRKAKVAAKKVALKIKRRAEKPVEEEEIIEEPVEESEGEELGEEVEIEIRGTARIGGANEDAADEEEAGEEEVEGEEEPAARRSATLHQLRRRSAAIRTQSVRIVAEHDNPLARAQAMGEALFTRINPANKPSPMARQYLGLSMPEMARLALRGAGYSTTALSPMETVTRALATTSDFPLAIEATLGNTLRPAYARPRGGIEKVARAVTVPNFDARKLVEFSEAPKLEKVNEAGEFKQGSFAEHGAPLYEVSTFGRIVNISRQVIVGDKLGFIDQIGTKFGNEAADFKLRSMVNMLVASAGLGPVMADGKTLFHVDHGNLAGSGAAISETTLSAARLALRRQKDEFGDPIQVTPKYLIVPPEQETKAEKELATIAATTTSDVNAFAKALELIVEPRLTNTNRWYIVAEDVPGLEWATLEGTPQPELRSEAGFVVDGVRTRVRLDFGAGFTDWRGWYSNPGA